MTMDMTRGKPLGLLIRFALPLMLSSLLQQIYTLCDSMIVGRILGSEAFAAIGSASYLQWFPLNMLLGCTMGFGVAFAQRFGAGDMKGLRAYLAAGAWLTALLGLVFTIGGVTFVGSLLSVMQTPAELLDMAVRYLRVLWGGLLATAALNLLSAALRAMGDSRTPFRALIVSSVANVGLDYLFLAGFGMGVEGAALATVLAQLTAALWCLRGLLRVKDAVPKGADWRMKKPAAAELLRLGVPMLLNGGVCSLGELAVQTAVNLQGVAFVTGITASRRYFELLNTVGNGLEGAVATFVGQNWGAGKYDRAAQGTRTAVRAGLAASLLTGLLIALLAEPLIRLFVPEGTPEILQAGVEALRVEALVLVSLYMLCEHRAAIQGMGNTVIPMLSGFMELAMRVLAAAALPVLAGRRGLYFTDAASWIPTAAMLIICYHVMCRKQLRKTRL